MIYFAIFSVLSLVAVFELSGKLGRARLPLLALSALFLTLFAGLKWETGTDWAPYQQFFQLSAPGTPWFSISLEPGFLLWNRLVAAILNNYSFYMTISAALCIALILFSLKGKAQYLFVALAVLFANTLIAFSLTRQTIASAILLAAFSCLADKKRLSFIALVLLAASFHVTALVGLLALVLDRHIKLSILLIAFLAFFVLGWLGAWHSALTLLANVLPSGHISYRILLYLQSSDAAGQAYPPFRELLGPAKHLFLFGIFAFYRYWKGREETNYRFFFNVYAVGIAIYLATFNDLSVFQRLFWYFNPIQGILVSSTLSIESGKRRVLLGGVYLAYFLVLLFFTLRSYWGEYVPYTWILS